jgi:hypothetical protein
VLVQPGQHQALHLYHRRLKLQLKTPAVGDVRAMGETASEILFGSTSFLETAADG